MGDRNTKLTTVSKSINHRKKGGRRLEVHTGSGVLRRIGPSPLTSQTSYITLPSLFLSYKMALIRMCIWETQHSARGLLWAREVCWAISSRSSHTGRTAEELEWRDCFLFPLSNHVRHLAS